MKLRFLYVFPIIFILIGTVVYNTNTVNNVSMSPSTINSIDLQNLNKDFPYPLIASSEVKDIVAKGNTISDMSKEFNDLGEIVKLSQAIFEGEVVNVAYFDLKNGPTCTKYAVKISKVLTGNLKKDDIVNVIELGGVTTAYNRIQLYGKEKEFPNISEEDSKKQYVQINWNGTPLSVVGDKVLLFAGQDTQDDWKLPKDYYYALGYKDGKFNIEGTNVERKVRPNESKKSFKMSEENIVAEIKKFI